MGNRCEQGLHSRYTAVGDRPAWGPAGGRQGVPDEGHRMISLCVPMDRAWSGLPQATTLGMLGTSKLKNNERFYGFTDFRGKTARRGRGTGKTRNSESSYRRNAAEH